MQVYGFAFGKGNISAYTLWRLKNIDCCYQIFPNNLESYLKLLLHNKPKYILGLGVYSGRDQDKIRIEKVCTNKFRNDFLKGDKLIEVEINLYLKPSQNSKYTQRMGNSWCNLASWKIMKLINEGKLHSKYTFLHLPKKLKTWLVVSEIDKMLAEFKENNNEK